MEKPPLGLLPRWLHNELSFDDLTSYKRMKDIEGAIARYEQADKPVPNEWRKELIEIQEANN